MTVKKICSILSVMMLTFAALSCIEIPNGVDPSAFVFVSQVRYVNLLRGSGVGAFFITTDTISVVKAVKLDTFPVALRVYTIRDSIYNLDTSTQRYTSGDTSITCHSGACDTTIKTVITTKQSFFRGDTVIHRDTVTTTTCINRTCGTITDTSKGYYITLTPHLIKTTVNVYDSSTGKRILTTTKSNGSVDTTLRRITVTKLDSLVNRYRVIAGDTTKVRVITSSYKRYFVDWDSTLDIVLDSSFLTSLQFGQSSPFINTNSGARVVDLKTHAQSMDTLLVIRLDSTYTSTYDTTGYGSFSHDVTDTTIKSNRLNVVTSHPIEYIDVDNARLITSTDFRGTVFLVNDTGSIGSFKYIFLNPLVIGESYTFSGRPSADSIKLRYVNASLNGGSKHVTFTGSYIVQKGSKIDTFKISQCPKGYSACPLDTIKFYSQTGYLTYPAGQDTARFRLLASQQYVDSSLFTRSDGGHRYTFVIVDNDTTFRVQRLTDD